MNYVLLMRLLVSGFMTGFLTFMLMFPLALGRENNSVPEKVMRIAFVLMMCLAFLLALLSIWLPEFRFAIEYI